MMNSGAYNVTTIATIYLKLIRLYEMNPIYRKTYYLSSAHGYHELPEDSGIEVAFAGRSNAGKSSAINALCDQKALAKTSNTPGRTQLINFFRIVEERSIVDLPGYGYAKVPQDVKAHWHKLLERYFNERQALAGLVLLMDCRHPLRDLDWQMLEWCRHHDLPSHVVLTKSDKLRGKAIQGTLESAEQDLIDHGFHETGIQMLSSSKKKGLDILCEKLDSWFNFDQT